MISAAAKAHVRRPRQEFVVSNHVNTIFERMSGDAQQRYLHALFTMAKTLGHRFGADTGVWLEANGSGLRMVYKAPTNAFNFAYGVPCRPAKRAENAPLGIDQRFYVKGEPPKMQRPSKLA